MTGVKLVQGDCLEVMKTIPDGSVDMVLADPPYGITACKWDNVIPFDLMWEQLKRLIKPNGAIVITATQPFTTKLIASNINMFKYCWYWKKSKPNGFQHSKNKPMYAIEECCVFSKASIGHTSQLGTKRMIYNPQGVVSSGKKTIKSRTHGRILGKRTNQVGVLYESYTNFPSNLLEYKNLVGNLAIHPTQKPVALMEYLIKTYTNESETVLDFTMGSGTTGVSCVNLNRNFIGIELDKDYFEIAKKRINGESIDV